MESFQITSMVLQALLVVLLIIGLVMLYKSILRRDADVKAALAYSDTSVTKLSEMDSTSKNIHRVQDASLTRLIEIEAVLKGYLPAIDRNTGESARVLAEVAATLKALAQSELETLTILRTASEIHTANNSGMTKLIQLTEDVASISRQIRASSADGVSAVKVTGETTAEKLEILSKELAELRKQLDEVTRF